MNRSHMLGTATDINAWADIHSSISELHVLMRKLIRASDRNAQIDGFRDEKGTALGGWDGIVDSRLGGAQVPIGRSLWELSTASGIAAKADEDYKKRTKNIQAQYRQNCAFIIVSARRWADKQAWQQSRTAEGEWREVRVFDADDIAAWLESFRAIHLEFSRQLGKAPTGSVALSTYWSDWRNATTWTISPEFLLAGRKDQADLLIKWLTGAPGLFNLQADTADEAIAVLAAVITQMSPEDTEVMFYRAIVVNDMADWNQLALRQEPLLLVARQADRSNVSSAVESGHHVFLPLGRGEKASDVVILPRVSLEGARKTLESANVEGRVAELAQIARHSVGAFRRKLARTKVALRPEWALSPEASELVPALLLTQWDDSNEHDQTAVEILSGQKYADAIRVYQSWSGRSDPPMRKTGYVWRVVAPQDSWELLAHLIDRAVVDKFKDLALEILDELDPKWDLAAEERMMARVINATPKYSEYIRCGISRTLALIGAFVMDQSSSSEDFVALAKAIVRALLEGQKPWQFWASHYETLSLLAEAAPDEFIDAIERDLKSANPSLKDVFQDDSDAFFSGSPHPGVLWALETLAWSIDYLAPAALALARLALLDPGGKVSNRPEDSLNRIFCSWHPCTGASSDERLRVIDLLRKKEPSVAWNLLISVLPRYSSSMHETAKPHYRDWVPETIGTITYGEISRTISQAVDWLLEDVGLDIKRWCELIEYARLIAEDDFRKVGNKLLTVEAAIKDPQYRWKLWDEIRKEIALHRRHEDKNARVSGEGLALLDQALKRFAPENPVLASKWLFNQNALFEIEDAGSDYTAEQKRLSELQQDAVLLVWQSGGISRLMELATGVDRPDMVGLELGRTLPRSDGDTGLTESLLSSENPVENAVGKGFVMGRACQHGEAWVSAVISDPATQGWAPELRAFLYAQMPFIGATWDELASENQEVIDAYWATARPWQRLNQQDFERAEEAFESCGRLGAAVLFIRAQDRKDGPKLSAERVLSLLAKLSKYDFAEDESGDSQSVFFGIYELLANLEESGEVDRNVLAQLQYTFLPLYTSHGRDKPRVLFEVLGEDPKLFIELLSSVFKSSNEAGDDEGVHSTEDRHRAEHNYRVLREWSLPPGCDHQGNVDAAKLKSWVTEARRLAARCGRAKICDQEIGQVLAYFPSDADGAWPHTALRELIEELSNEELERGIVTGIFNSRGAHSRTMSEGGDQERAIAAQYSDYAEQTRTWPRTSRMLRRVEERYLSDAKREDDERELREDGIF